jgi:hypothetical protein
MTQADFDARWKPPTTFDKTPEDSPERKQQAVAVLNTIKPDLDSMLDYVASSGLIRPRK